MRAAAARRAVRLAALVLALAVAAGTSGCGGVGLSVSARPTVALQVSVLGSPTLRLGPRYPRVACYGYQNGWLCLGAPARRVYTSGLG